MKPCAGCPCLHVRKNISGTEARCIAKAKNMRAVERGEAGRMICWQYGMNRSMTYYTVWGMLYLKNAPRWCPVQKKEAKPNEQAT